MAASTAPLPAGHEVEHHLSSVEGLVELLVDADEKVKQHALCALLHVVDLHWYEIADGLNIIEGLALDARYAHRKTAALLAAKIMYNLDSLDDAVNFALTSEDLFDVSGASEFSRSITAAAVQNYCAQRLALFESAVEEDQAAVEGDVEVGGAATSMQRALAVSNGRTPADAINAQLERLVERLIEDARKNRGREGEIEAVGVAIDARRLDEVEKIIMASEEASDLIQYCVKQAETTVRSRRFSQILLKRLIAIHQTKFPVTNSSVLRREATTLIRGLFLTNDVNRVAQILSHLLMSESSVTECKEEDQLIALQIAFDLVSYESQQFLSDLLKHPLLQLRDVPVAEQPAAASAPSNQAPAPATSTSGTPEKQTDGPSADDVTQPLLSAEASAPQPKERVKSLDEIFNEKIKRLRDVLEGKTTMSLVVEFLHSNNHSDLHILDEIKNAADSRALIVQNGLIIAHALAQAGTTCDVYYRQNLEWLGKAICWFKFIAAASVGVLHKGHATVSRQVLSAYLPGAGGGPYSEGGALCGLGLIHANQFNEDIRKYLLEQLAAAEQTCPQNFEPLQHGACLGLGIMAMGTSDPSVYGALREILFKDSAVAGEAAALGLGLLALGSASPAAVSELLSYGMCTVIREPPHRDTYAAARDTEHEKIIRAASLGVAFCMYGKQEQADPVIEDMARDKDPMIRYSAMYALGLAYCATSNSNVVRRLLHVGVADVSNDVRRAAVIAVGFVLCNSADQIPRIVCLLADSFNPHLRYAAALAIGFGCAGTALPAAVNILFPMTQDTSDFVRQGALLALGLVLVQASATALPENKVQQIRDLLLHVACDRHEDGVTRFGAVIAQGLIDAGGRNSTIGFFSSTGALRCEAVVGFTLFAQLWYWYPLVLMIALAFRPTALIGLKGDLTMPSDFEVACEAPSLAAFEYIEPLQSRAKRDEKPEAEAAVLSATEKRQQREQMRKMAAAASAAKPAAAPEDDVVMEKTTQGEEASSTHAAPIVPPEPSEAVTNTAEETKESKEGKPERLVLKNPCRVILGQEPYMNLNMPTSPWIPIDLSRKAGIVVLKPNLNLAAREKG